MEREDGRMEGWRDGEQVLVKATRLCICHRREDGMRTSTSAELGTWVKRGRRQPLPSLIRIRRDTRLMDSFVAG